MAAEKWTEKYSEKYTDKTAKSREISGFDQLLYAWSLRQLKAWLSGSVEVDYAWFFLIEQVNPSSTWILRAHYICYFYDINSPSFSLFSRPWLKPHVNIKNLEMW